MRSVLDVIAKSAKTGESRSREHMIYRSMITVVGGDLELRTLGESALLSGDRGCIGG